MATLPVNKIHKAVDDGKSMDAIVGMFADKRTTNTDDIRKIVKDYKFKTRIKKKELDEVVPSPDKVKWKPDPKLKNLKLRDIPSTYEKRKAYRDNPNEDTSLVTEAQFDEAAGEKDACYRKVKSRYKVWPSAYASGALVQCRKKGAANWGNSKKK